MRIAVALLAASSVFPSGAGAYIAGVADGLPFLGDWDCGVGVFVFAPDHYRPGADADPLPYRQIEALDRDGKVVAGDARDAAQFILTFDDGDRIGLSDVTATTMVWLSGASGDTVDCPRIVP